MLQPEIKIGLSGIVSWRVENADGVTTRSGRQKNLITDNGLDDVAQGLNNLLRHFAIGTGSTAPANSDTALDNEIASFDGGQTPGISVISGNKIRVRRTYDSGIGGATGNLTEFGGRRGSTGVLNSRELFRDGVGDPITVTVTSSEKLVVTYDLEVAPSPLVSAPGTGTADITNIGIIGVSYGFNFPSSRPRAPYDLIHNIARAGSVYIEPSEASGLPALTDDLFVGTGSGSPERAGTVSSYTAGSHERTVEVTWGSGVASFTHRSYMYGHNNTGIGSDRPASFHCAIDTGDEFAKDGDYQLTLDAIKLSWSRA